MAINLKVANLFKPQAIKTTDKSKIGRGGHFGVFFPSAHVKFYSGKKTFNVDNLSQGKPLEHTSSLLPYADVHAKKQQKILSKVKSAKNSITKLFKPAHRGSATNPCIDPIVPSVKNCGTTDHSSFLSLSPILQQSIACVVTADESIAPTQRSLETVSPHTTNDEKVADERIEDFSATPGSVVKAAFPSSTRFTTPESALDALSATLTLLLSERLAPKEEGRRTEVVARTKQRELAVSASYISRSTIDSGVTVYLTSCSLSSYATASELYSVGLEIDASPNATSIVTSVDADDGHQVGTHRRLRRVASYEDLRNSRIVASRDFADSDLSRGPSNCDISDRTTFSIHAASKTFSSLGIKLRCQKNEFRKLRAWLSARCHESSHNMKRTPTSRATIKVQKVAPTPISKSRHFLQANFRPSSRVRMHVSTPSLHQRPPPSVPPIWSCATITRSNLKAKRRQKMTKQSMRELKARLDSMDIDPWY